MNSREVRVLDAAVATRARTRTLTNTHTTPMVLPVALGGAILAPGARRAPEHGGLARGARRVPVVSRRMPRRVAVRAAAETPGPAETDEQREARIGDEAVRLVEYRLKKVLPAGMLESIVIPPKLTEIRSFVRWEEAGKPENTSREWQVREYQAALVDLKLEMLAGGNLNDIRRRYSLDTEFGEDAPVHTPTVPELQLLKIAADIVKEREYYDPAKIAAIEDAETKASQERIEKATEKAKLDKAKTTPEAVTEDLETVQALELAFETDVKDIGAADAAAAVEEADDLHARIAAAAEVMVEKTAEAAARGADAEAAKALELASLGDDATLGLGAFGDDEIAVLKARLQQEAEIARDKARVKAEAAKRVKLQMEALAAKAKKAKADAKAEAEAPAAAPAAAKAPEAPAPSPAQKKQRELAKAKAAAEAQLAAARAEMDAAKAALESSAARKATVMAAPDSEEAPVAAKKDVVPEPAFPPPPVASPAEAPPVAAKAPAAPAAKAPAPPPTANAAAAYGVTRSATEVEAKAAAKRLAAAKDAERAKTAALELRRERAAAEKRAAEAEVLAAKDAKRAASASASAVAAAVDDRVKALETLHAKHVETLLSEHEQALAAARAAAAAELSAELADSASSSERLLRSKLGEAVTALEVSNEQCKSLKAKLARGREELEKVKTITAKAAEVLESRSADQRLIKSLKRELDVAVELEAAAEARAAAAEKSASALKKQVETPLGAKPSSERIAELESDLREANEILAEFKQSWEADRKVIALLSQMKDAEEAKDAADAARLADAAAKAKDDSNLKSAGLWGLAKKYGKKTLEISSELWFGEGKDADAADVALRASAAKRNNTLAAKKADDEEEDAYARVGGSATVARLRAKAGAAGSDTKTRVRQMSWLAAADTAAEAAAAEAAAEAEKKAPKETAAKKTPKDASEPAERVAAKATKKTAEVAPEAPAAAPVVAETQKNNAVPLPKVGAPAAPAAEPVAAAAKAKPAPKAWGASATATPATPFTPSIVIPPAADDDETPKSSGWSSAHMPPGR